MKDFQNSVQQNHSLPKRKVPIFIQKAGRRKEKVKNHYYTGYPISMNTNQYNVVVKKGLCFFKRYEKFLFRKNSFYHKKKIIFKPHKKKTVIEELHILNTLNRYITIYNLYIEVGVLKSIIYFFIVHYVYTGSNFLTI